MILQALNQLYERLADDPAYDLPTPGHSVQRVSFCITLNADGSLQGIQDARETVSETTRAGQTRSKQIARSLLVPGDSKPSGQGINPCTLWDNAAYLLGYKKPDKDPEKAAKEQARAILTFEASRSHHLALEREIDDPSYSAVCRFLERWSPEKASDWTEALDDFAATGFGVFRVLPENGYVHERKAFKAWWSSQLATTVGEVKQVAPCLVTGKDAPVARLHDPPIKGVNGAAPGGAKLASFNQDAFESYAKRQSHNSPVSERATFQYCNALNALLSGPQSRRHRVTVGDSTVVFWTERETVAESIFASFLGGGLESGDMATERSEDPLLSQKLEAFLNVLRRGGGAAFEELGDDPHTRFYILALNGNVTRLAVRFWQVGTLGDLFDRLQSHFEALRVDRSFENEPEFPSAIRLLDQTARERKAITPLLSGQLMQAILAGTRYPMPLYNGVLNRLRSNDPVNYLKASVLKAVLTRNFQQTISMSLDPDRTEPAYLLGRLFAALEKTQEDALGKVNAGIRERFYSSASATPGAVFPRILRTYQHHLAKMPTGALAERIGSERAAKAKTFREVLIQSIHAPLSSYPSHLNLEEQGLFAIGYYHQRQAFFAKAPTESEASETNLEETVAAG